MGRQLIRCPDGGYNLFSTVVDDWLFEQPCTAEQYRNWRLEEALEKLKADVEDEIARADKGKVNEMQYTYAEADALSKKTRRAQV